MSPEERDLLERAVKLGEENRQLLRGVRSTLRWNQVWGLIKIAIFVVPFIVGYFYLQPYLGSIGTSFDQAKALFTN